FGRGLWLRVPQTCAPAVMGAVKAAASRSAAIKYRNLMRVDSFLVRGRSSRVRTIFVKRVRRGWLSTCKPRRAGRARGHAREPGRLTQDGQTRLAADASALAALRSLALDTRLALRSRACQRGASTPGSHPPILG